jgi:hypothetical protein
MTDCGPTNPAASPPIITHEMALALNESVAASVAAKR